MATLADKYEDGWKSIDSREKKLKDDIENFRYSSNQDAQSRAEKSRSRSSNRDFKELNLPAKARFSREEVNAS
jgi:hypothetical protein